MTTAESPEHLLRAQADRIADRLRSMMPQPPKGSIKPGIVMDDKLITIEIEWQAVANLTRDQLSDFILAYMRKKPGA